MQDTTIYNTKDFQETLINFMISDQESFTRVQNIVEEQYFADHLRPVVRMIKDYAQKHNRVPTPELIKAETRHGATIIEGVVEHVDWFLETTESFCRHRALENIIHAGPDILSKGQGGDLERQVKDAMMISLVTDLGSDFFENVRERIEARRDRSNYISTGWKSLDVKLGGGFTRGSLNIFAGGSGCVIAGTEIMVRKLVGTEYSNPYPIDIIDMYDVNDGASYLANSPDGFVPVEQWRNKGLKECFTVGMNSGKSITASHDHLFQKSDSTWVYTRDLGIGDILLTQDGPDTIMRVAPAGNQIVYDLAIGHDEHRYYTNGISSHNSGKSIFLQNQALNWVAEGMNVVYITLELSETLVNERLEAMLTQYATRDLIRNVDKAALKIAKFNKVAKGDLRVKKFPEGGTTCNTIRAYLKEYQIKTGKKPDGLVVDYLDLLYPNNAKIDISNLFSKDKFVSEELRAIGSEWDIPVASASQLNRAAVDAQEFDHSHVAGGLSKVQTCDNFFGIFTSMTMRQNGMYEVQLLKTRSAASVGQKLKLAYDVNCMRLTDLDEDTDDLINNHTNNANNTNSSLQSPNNSSTIGAQPPSQIDALLAQLKFGNTSE